MDKTKFNDAGASEKSHRVLFVVECTNRDIGGCIRFEVNEQKQTVDVVDGSGGKASMSIQEYNKLVRAVRNGEVKEVGIETFARKG